MTSVLQPWVMQLTLREQGTLLTGVRGCDLTPKMPLDSTERQLTGYLRSCILVPADPREVGYVGGFFQPDPPNHWKQSELGHYPLHWVSHIMHCFEVIGYRHPNSAIRAESLAIYVRLVRGLHLTPETYEQMLGRMTEDRIANNTVVS